jgi:hypothetical protein
MLSPNRLRSAALLIQWHASRRQVLAGWLRSVPDRRLTVLGLAGNDQPGTDTITPPARVIMLEHASWLIWSGPIGSSARSMSPWPRRKTIPQPARCIKDLPPNDKDEFLHWVALATL